MVNEAGKVVNSGWPIVVVPRRAFDFRALIDGKVDKKRTVWGAGVRRFRGKQKELELPTGSRRSGKGSQAVEELDSAKLAGVAFLSVTELRSEWGWLSEFESPAERLPLF